MSELLKSKGVKALLSGYLISNIGSWFRMLAVMGLLYDITGTTASLGFSIIIRYLPKFLVNIFFIHHISAINKQTLLLSGSLLSCLSVLTLAVTSPLHSVAIIYPLLVLISIGDSLIDPARMSSVRQLSNKQNMGKNTASFTIARELTMLFSASTGGILISLIGTTYTLMLDGISYFMAILLFAFLPRGFLSGKINQSEANPLLLAFRMFTKKTKVSLLLRVCFVRQLGYGIAMVGFSALVFRDLQLDASWLGWAYSAGGAAAILAGMSFRRKLKRSPLNPGSALNTLTLAYIVSVVFMATMLSAPSIMVFFIFVALYDASSIVTDISLETALMLHSDEDGAAFPVFFALEGVGILLGAMLYSTFLHEQSQFTVSIIVTLIMAISAIMLGLSRYSEKVKLSCSGTGSP
ncbi:MFS transporter [Gynuella sp.]|uniref:MFS transporter n=1 Tax=Gynuella sp. TaxID=2969146 RepID=UPI003D0EC628